MDWRSGAAAEGGLALFARERASQPADPDIDHLTCDESPGGVQPGPINPRTTHAPEVAQPVGSLPVTDPRVAARNREVFQPNRVLRPTTYRRTRSCDLECWSRLAFGFESQNEPDPSRSRRLDGGDLCARSRRRRRFLDDGWGLGRELKTTRGGGVRRDRGDIGGEWIVLSLGPRRRLDKTPEASEEFLDPAQKATSRLVTPRGLGGYFVY